MDIKQYLSSFKKKFDPRLENFLIKKQNQAKKLAPSYALAIKEIRRLNQAGGKRLRPALIYTALRANNGKDNQEAWNACIAMELIQAFALIHDDIMDKAKTRRGEITSFKKLGINKALLIGDLALILADELIPEKAKDYFNLLKFEMAGGQWLDINKNLSLIQEKQALTIMDLKSARYTITRPLQIGAALAKAEKKIIKAFYNYGRNTGLAFQIQDDILGIFGNEKTLGKPVGSDIAEKKKTLLISQLLKSKVDKRKINQFLKFFGKRRKLSKQELKFTQNLLKESKALDFCQKKSVQLIKQAKKSIINLEINKKEKDFLLELGNYIINRNQ